MQDNKTIVRRFNKEVIEEGNRASFEELVAPAFINHTAMKGVDPGPAGLIYVFEEILRPAFPDLKVVILDQVAEGDKVTTRKVIYGTHTGRFFDIAPTGRAVTINVIDIVTVRNGKYVEHWGINTISSLRTELAAG